MEQNVASEEPIGPRVSAILIGYDQAPLLRRAIEALERSKDGDRLEILVVDCGSQDDSSQLDTEYPSITMLRLPHNFGATKAMNIATRTAKATFLFYLAPDVEVFPDTVTRLAGQLDANPDSVAVCPLLVDKDERPVSRISRIPDSSALSTVCRGGELPSVDLDLTQENIAVEYPGRDALLVRKQFVAGMNYFDQRFGEFWADADLAMQIHKAQKKIRLFPSIRATLHRAVQPGGEDPLLTADRVVGAATFVGKYSGFLAGLGFRLSAMLVALGRLDLRLFAAILGGQKLDGSQASE